jgi:two-component system cell cycle sensor histidine kinase/response regulator CckA
MIIDVGKHILERLGYEVVTAKSGQEAIDVFKKQTEEIDLVVLDMIMPETSGSDTFDYLKAINPEVKVLLSSGYSISGQATDILKRGCDGFIQKPFDISELSIKVEEILTN